MITTSESGLRDTNPQSPPTSPPSTSGNGAFYRTLNSESCKRLKERRSGSASVQRAGASPRVWSIDGIVGLLDRRTERAAEQQEERDGSYVTSSRRPWTGSSIRSVDKNFGGSRSRHELFHLGVGRPFLHQSHGTQDETGKVGVGRIVRLDNRRLPAVAGVGFKLKHYPEYATLNMKSSLSIVCGAITYSRAARNSLYRLLFRVRVARMRFGKTNPFELGHAGREKSFIRRLESSAIC